MINWSSWFTPDKVVYKNIVKCKKKTNTPNLNAPLQKPWFIWKVKDVPEIPLFLIWYQSRLDLNWPIFMNE